MPPQTTTDGTQIDPSVVKVMKAIKQTETGDSKDPWNQTGDSGASMGAYQWNNDGVPLRPGQLPSHWKNAAQQYLGDANAPMSSDNQNKVAYHQIKAYKDQGKDPEEIAALWNGAKKDPATGKFTYINPAYGEKFRAAIQGQSSQPTQPQGNGYVQTPPYTPPAPDTTGSLSAPDTNNSNSSTSNQPEGLGSKALDVAKGVGNFLFPIVADVYHDIKGDSKKTFLQQAGDTALSVLPFIPGLGEVGLAAKGTEAAVEGGGLLAKLAGSTIAKGAGVGYGAGVAANLSSGKGLGESFLPNASTIGGAALGGLAPVALKGLGNLATKASGISPQILTELKNMGLEGNSADAKLYEQYINATKAHATNLRTPSPLTMAADNLDTAAGKIDTSIDTAGKAVGAAKKAGATIPIAQPDIANVGTNFAKQVEEKYGLTLTSDATGKVSAVPISGNMRQVVPADVSRIENIATQLNQLYANGDSATIKNASDIISNLNELVDHSKDDLYGHTNDPLSGLIKSTAGDLNQAVRKGSSLLADANDRFSGLKDLQGEIGGMAGKNLNKGELLMRRVFSGDKSGDVQDLFEKIKQETGIDLTKHAVLAKHAIETVGSKADKTLLEQIIQSGGNDKLGLIKGLLSGAAKKTFANPEKIGRNLVKGGSKGLMNGLITKGAIRVGAGL